MTDNTNFVESTLDRVYSGYFQKYANMLQAFQRFDSEKYTVDKFTGVYTSSFSNLCPYSIMVDSAHFLKSAPLKVFNGSFQYRVKMV